MMIRPTRPRNDPIAFDRSVPTAIRLLALMTAPTTTQMIVAGKGSISRNTSTMYKSRGRSPIKPHQRLNPASAILYSS